MSSSSPRPSHYYTYSRESIEEYLKSHEFKPIAFREPRGSEWYLGRNAYFYRADKVPPRKEPYLILQPLSKTARDRTGTGF